jgi:pyruvate kinase
MFLPHTRRKVKIVVTLGKDVKKDVVRAMVERGATIFRLNLSHGNFEQQRRKVDVVREVEQELNIPLAIMLDTRGPEIRIVDVSVDRVEPGDRLLLFKDVVLSVMPKRVFDGQEVIYADGVGKFVVKDKALVAINGFNIERGKKLLFKGVDVDVSNPTPDDVQDLELAKGEVDGVALSFTTSARQLERVREVMGSNVEVIAKIENTVTLSVLDEVLEHSDGIMVARGDLGLETELERLPVVQRTLMERSVKKGKFVIVATELLKSMVHQPVPTRAEVNDIAYAVWNYASALMLSDETTVGKYPVRSVEVMDKTIYNAETVLKPHFNIEQTSSVDVIGAKLLDALSSVTPSRFIVVKTHKGFTAKLIARELPSQPVFVTSPDKRLLRRLNFYYALVPVFYDDPHTFITTERLRGKGVVVHLQPSEIVVKFLEA